MYQYNKNHLIAVLLLKIIILFLFSSEYSTQLFQPFVSTFIQESMNPWQYYFDNQLNLEAFPYHALMLIILYPFSLLSNLLSIQALFKIPLLITDLLIFWILNKLFPNKKNKVFIFYFINPIIIYAIFIHSQLDIIPTFLFLYSIYALIQHRYRFSSFFLGCAIATKLHIIIALPLVFFYLYKSKGLGKAVRYNIVVLMVFILFDFPFLMSSGFAEMVLFNAKQSLLFDSYYLIGNLKLFLPIAAILMVYLHFINQNKINNDLFFSYCGLLFTVIIFFIYPAPAWYVWMTPFLSIYFIVNNYSKQSILLYTTLSLSYLIFFIFFYQSDYQDMIFLDQKIDLKINNEKLAHISFTFLEITLFASIYSFYSYGIKSNILYKKINNLAIGISGDSGTGKTTLLNSFDLLLGNRILQIEGDGDHKWERNNSNWKHYTHLNPKANNIHDQANAIFQLKNNQTVFRSIYDHQTGKFTEPVKLYPKDFIFIAGLHPLYLPKLRKILDLKIFLDTEEKLRMHWKLIRDTHKRDYNRKNVLEQIHKRKNDAKNYIHPQKQFADIVIKYFSIHDFEIGDENQVLQIGLHLTLDANIHIEDTLNQLQVDFQWDYNEDLKTQYLELKEVPSMNYDQMVVEIIPNLDEIIIQNYQFGQGYEGLVQLIILKMMSDKLMSNSSTNEI